MYRMQEEVSRLRALAASCREVARVIRYRPDQEVAQAQARHYEDAEGPGRRCMSDAP